MRLHELAPAQIEEWRKARMDAGRAKYGDAHMQRYGLVDVMEELLDAINILRLHNVRIFENNRAMTPQMAGRVTDIMHVLDDAMEALADIDAMTPAHLCTDEQGGERIWWSEQARYKACGACGETPAWCGCEEGAADGD